MYIFYVFENVMKLYVVGLVIVIDEDIGFNGMIIYYIFVGNFGDR